MPDLPLVAIPHPLGGIPEREVRERAESAIEEIIKKATQFLPSPEIGRQRGEECLQLKGSIEEVTSFFYSKGWTDGLPIWPPTPGAVQEMLTGTDLRPDHLLGLMAPQNGKATVEKIAVNAVMAGCRPTYLPILVAALEGLFEEDFDLMGVQTSTGPHSPLLIINGPVRHQIGVNGGSGALGPGWQANATIGRAIRLILNNSQRARLVGCC